MNTILLTNETTSNTWSNLEIALDKSDIVIVRMAISYLMKSGANLVKKRLSNLISKGIPSRNNIR